MTKENNTCPTALRQDEESRRLTDPAVGKQEQKHTHGERGLADKPWFSGVFCLRTLEKGGGLLDLGFSPPLVEAGPDGDPARETSKQEAEQNEEKHEG